MPRSNRFDRLEQFAVDVILERRWGFRAGLFRLFLWFLSGLYRLGGALAALVVRDAGSARCTRWAAWW